jgi:RNA 2',3'-cyclic 3'-phosphodiesterase
LAGERDRWRWSDSARPVIDEKLHVTLHFIGPVVRERLDDVVTGLAVEMRPFTLAFGRHALWRNGVAALEPVAADGLAPLHASLADALRLLALPPEGRRFRPHVTLARDARGSIVPDAAEPFTWTIDRYALVESRPDGGYEVLAVL